MNYFKDINRDTDEEARELLQDGDKQSDKKECIPECVIERYGDKEEGAIFEVAELDESLEIEPDFIQVDEFVAMWQELIYVKYSGKNVINIKFLRLF